MPGRLIVLNGTSSAGKTSIINDFVSIAPELYLKLGIDNALNFLPKHYFDQPLWNEVMGKSNQAGPLGDQLMAGMNQAIKGLLDSGFNVIADHVIIEDGWYQDIQNTFKDYEFYLVGIFCPREVIAKREIERKNRTLGSAELQFDVVHKNKNYSLTLDSSQASPKESAQKILAFIETNFDRTLSSVVSSSAHVNI